MKTINIARVPTSISVAMLLCFAATTSFAQRDPSKEVLVYVTSGIERAPFGQPARITAASIEGVLRRAKIDRSLVTSAFPDFNEADTLRATPEGRLISMPNMGRIFRIRVPDGVTCEAVIDTLKKLPTVLFAERNGSVEFDVIPNDQHFSFQWSMQVGGGTGRIRAAEAWDIFQGSASTKIGIIDGGVDATHPDLSGKVSGHTDLYGYHGTHVAGIASARTHNSTGIAGVDWNAQILTKSISGADDDDDTYIYTQVVNLSNEGADAINNSWRLTPTGRYSTIVRMGFAYAYKNNKVAVATIGNTGNTTNTVQYPGSFGIGIIAVGATDQADARADFSTYGSAIDVAAPGVLIPSTYRYGDNFYNQQGQLDPNYQYLSGTSMAAPHVTGIASLLKGYNPSLYNDDIEHIIQLSADDVNSATYPGWDQFLGHGRVNAHAALQRLQSPYVLTQATAVGGGDYGPSGSYWMAIYGAQQWGLSDGYYYVEKHEVRRSVSYSYVAQPQVWGRGAATVGWAHEGSVNFGLGHCTPVQGTVTSTSATLSTHVYKVWNSLGQYLGWKPVSPTEVTYAYTVHGRIDPLSVSISGPSEIYHPQKGTVNHYTWTSNPVGGIPPYTYRWFKYPYEVSTSSTYTEHLSFDGWGGGYTQWTLQLEVRDAVQSLATASMLITEYHSGGDPLPRMADVGEPILALPDYFSISQNYPNPFNPETEISFGLPEPSAVRITIVDILGREIAMLADRDYPAGYQRTTWRGTDASGSKVGSGVYFYRIIATGQSGKQFSKVMKMALTK